MKNVTFTNTEMFHRPQQIHICGWKLDWHWPHQEMTALSAKGEESTGNEDTRNGTAACTVWQQPIFEWPHLLFNWQVWLADLLSEKTAAEDDCGEPTDTDLLFTVRLFKVPYISTYTLAFLCAHFKKPGSHYDARRRSFASCTCIPVLLRLDGLFTPCVSTCTVVVP
jgi:hypothetical protein